MEINKASDLHFTYVQNTPELRGALITKCAKFDIGVFAFSPDERYLEVYADNDGIFEICGTYTLEENSKELTIEDLAPEEKPSEKAEWANGDECIYMNSSEVHKFIGVDPTQNDFCYIKANCSAVNWVEVAKLSKPETPQQREDRERLALVASIPFPDFEAWFWELDSVDRNGEYRMSTKLKLSNLISEHYRSLFDSGKIKIESGD